MGTVTRRAAQRRVVVQAPTMRPEDFVVRRKFLSLPVEDRDRVGRLVDAIYQARKVKGGVGGEMI